MRCGCVVVDPLSTLRGFVEEFPERWLLSGLQVEPSAPVVYARSSDMLRFTSVCDSDPPTVPVWLLVPHGQR